MQMRAGKLYKMNRILLLHYFDSGEGRWTHEWGEKDDLFLCLEEMSKPSANRFDKSYKILYQDRIRYLPDGYVTPDWIERML